MFFKPYASNKGKTAGRYQFDTHPTGIGLSEHKYAPNDIQEIPFPSFPLLFINCNVALDFCETFVDVVGSDWEVVGSP